MSKKIKVNRSILTSLVTAHISAHGSIPNENQFNALADLADEIEEATETNPELKIFMRRIDDLIQQITSAPPAEEMPAAD